MAFVGVSILCKVKHCSGLSVQRRTIWAGGRSCDSSHTWHTDGKFLLSNSTAGLFCCFFYSLDWNSATCKMQKLLISDPVSPIVEGLGEPGDEMRWESFGGNQRMRLDGKKQDRITSLQRTEFLSFLSLLVSMLGKGSVSQAVFRNLFWRSNTDIKISFSVHLVGGQ